MDLPELIILTLTEYSVMSDLLLLLQQRRANLTTTILLTTDHLTKFYIDAKIEV